MSPKPRNPEAFERFLATSKEILAFWYWNENLRIADIAQRANVSIGVVRRRLLELGITRRNKQQAIARGLETMSEDAHQRMVAPSRANLHKSHTRSEYGSGVREDKYQIELFNHLRQSLDGMLIAINHPVDNYSYFVDIAFPDLMLAIEVDGWWHKTTKYIPKDEQRLNRIRELGWEVAVISKRNSLESAARLVEARVHAKLDTSARPPDIQGDDVLRHSLETRREED